MNNLYVKAKNLAFKIIDGLSRKKGIGVSINDMKMKVPGRYWRYFPKDYEKESFLFVKKALSPGFTCLDIGAHMGVYAVYMAQLQAGKVFSFEPTPSSYKILEKTISLNKSGHIITPVPAAIAERSGMHSFYINRPLSTSSYIDQVRVAEANSLADIDHGRNIATEKIEVTAWSVDDFVLENRLKVNFIKVDAEGAETNILKGAARTMTQDRPSGIIGLHIYAYPDKANELSGIWDMMNTYGMKMLYNQEEMTKEKFMATRHEELVDVQFVPIGCFG